MFPAVSVWKWCVCRVIKIILSAKFVSHFQVTHRNTDANEHIWVCECTYTYTHQTKRFQNQTINKYSRIQFVMELHQNLHEKFIFSQFRRLLTISPSFCDYYQPSHTQFTGFFKKIALLLLPKNNFNILLRIINTQ